MCDAGSDEGGVGLLMQMVDHLYNSFDASGMPCFSRS